MKNIIIHIKAPDQGGIVSQYTHLLSSMNINIINLEQHVEPDDLLFFMRIHAVISDGNSDVSFIKSKIKDIDEKLDSQSVLYDLNYKQNIAVLVTKESLPLYDILIKNQTDEINSNIRVIVSNHNDLKNISNQFSIDFVHLDMDLGKDQMNIELEEILSKNNIDLVVLARYMQIIPKRITNRFSGRMINIHHGFLPAFKGDHPYRQAWKRGVKIIGATAHYVTDELDEGPIISQDVIPVNHHHSVSEMIESGRNLERNVLIDAIKAHLEHRIIIHGKRTIIFNK